MNPNDPTWDDTSFEPDDNTEGFASAPERRVVPEPTPVQRAVPSRSRIVQPLRPKKKRGALFWFSMLAAGVLLVAVIGGALYYFAQPSTEDQAFVAPANESPTVTVPSENAIVDTTREIETVVPEVKPVHDDDAIAALEGTEEKNREIEKSKPTPKPTPTPTPKPTPKPVAPIVSEPKKIESKKVLPPPVIAEKKPEPQEVRQPTSSKAPLYVVQVFSSPSRDDADEWLQLLRGKNVGDGYITEQKIKGQSWYRVRFGQYTTRESAESEALRYGFKEPWIARVR